ncbi:hypothetical protein [Methylomagnum sp.]
MSYKDPYPWTLARPVILDNVVILAAAIMFGLSGWFYFLGESSKVYMTGTVVGLLVALLKYRDDSLFKKNYAQLDLLSGCFVDMKILTFFASMRNYIASRSALVLIAVGVILLLNNVVPMA